MAAGALGHWGSGLAGLGGKGPIGRRTTRTAPVGGRGRLSSCLQSEGVAPGKFKMKADTMNWLAGTGQMLANVVILQYYDRE